MSHVKHIKTIQQFTRDKVMALLGWNDLQYGQFQMERAYAYLDFHIGADVWGVKELRENAGFWAWWRNHWHKRDMQFVTEVKNLTREEMVLLYEITHDAEAMEFTPHSALMRHTFAAEMINPAAGRPAPKERRVRL